MRSFKTVALAILFSAAGVVCSHAQNFLADNGIFQSVQALGAHVTVGSSLYPVYGTQRFDLNSSLIANSLGSKYIFAGAAAIDGNTWVNASPYLSGIAAAGDVNLWSIATGGEYATVSALRSSDRVSAVTNVIADACVIAHDNTTTGHGTWCRYEHGVIAAGSAASLHLNDENSVLNNGSAVQSDPYTPNPSGGSFNLRLDSGIGTGVGNDVSAGLHIIQNGAKYRSAIIIGSDALDTVANAQPDALAMGPNHSLTWYSAASTKTWLAFVDSSQNMEIVPAGATAFVQGGAIAENSISFNSPTSGFSITVAAGYSNVILSPAGVLATGTITTPASPTNGQLLHIGTSQQITALTFTANAGQTNGCFASGTTLPQYGSIHCIYNSANAVWYPN